MSMLTDMHDALTDAGIAAYLPGKAEGVVTGPRAVLADGGLQAWGKTTGRRFFYVTGAVPAERPGDLPALLGHIQAALTAVSALRFTGEITEATVDDDFKAYVATIEFSALCGL